MAIRWLLQQKGVTSVIIGASKKQQIIDNLAALEGNPLTQKELDAIEKIVQCSK